MWQMCASVLGRHHSDAAQAPVSKARGFGDPGEVIGPAGGVQPAGPGNTDGTRCTAQAEQAGHSWSRRDWASAYQTTAAEPEGYWLEIEGRLPPDLCGTYFRNGPGAFEVGTQPVAHPFDGQGLVTSIAIREGRAFFRSRYVETAEFAAESRQHRLLFRATFGTQHSSQMANLLDIIPKNVANTNVLVWGGRCLVLFEAGQPYRLDARSLQTQGMDLLGGAVRPGVPFALGTPALDKAAAAMLRAVGVGKHLPGGLQLGGDAVTAHPHVDPLTGRLVLYSYRIRLGAGAPPAPASPACSAGKQAPQQPCCQPAGDADQLSRQSPQAGVQPTPGRRGGLAGCKRSREGAPGEGGGSQQGPADHPPLPGTGDACRLGRLSGALGWVQGLGQLTTELTFHEFDQDMQLVSQTVHSLAGYAFLHDFAVTRQHYVVFQNPVRLSLAPFILGQQGPAQCVDWAEGEPMQVHLIPRPGPASDGAQDKAAAGSQAAAAPGSVAGGHPAQHSSEAEASPAGCKEPAAPRGLDPAVGETLLLQAEPGFVFHHANAYVEGGRITVDCVRYPRLPDFKGCRSDGHTFVQTVEPDAQPISQLWRYILHPGSGLVEDRQLFPRALEYPSVNPDYTGRRHRYIYAAAALHPTLNRPQQALAKLDVDTQQCQVWTRGPQYYVGEPQFLPRTRSFTAAPSSQAPRGNHSHQHSRRAVEGEARGAVPSSQLPRGRPHHGDAAGCPSSLAAHAKAALGPSSQLPQYSSRSPLGGAAGCPAGEAGGAEDDGWLLAMCFNAAQRLTELVVLDAQQLQAGPVATLKLRDSVPHGLHGNWAEEYLGPL